MYYRKLSEYLIETFGEKVYKISLEGGFTCPNRDGTKGTNGCIFCKDGSGAFATSCNTSITEQIEKAKVLVENKNKQGKYIAYFQSYTNTYGPVVKLRKIFSEAIMHPDIVALSIGTRPDCLEPDKIELIKELASIKPVFVELGLQTIHSKTAGYIRRGYDLSVYDEAVKNLKNAGAMVVTHMIVGLPGESREDIVETARYIGKTADGIKIQLLHILKGTDLEKDYEKGIVRPLELKEYTEICEACIRALPKNVVVHRITGDGAKKDLVAPLWSADKKRVLNYMNKKFLDDNIEQGTDI